MILMGDRRAEQRHDPVAHDLVDGALVAMHGIHHHADRAIEDAARLFRVSAFDDRERALDVGEQHRDVLALAGQLRTSVKDALGEMVRRVGVRCRRARRRRPIRHRRVEPGNRCQQLLAVAQRGDTELLEVVPRKRAKDFGVDVVRREHLGVLAEIVALQPGADVHGLPRSAGPPAL